MDGFFEQFKQFLKSNNFNSLTAIIPFLLKFAIFGLSASVYIRPLPGALVAEFLGVVLGVQDHKNIKFPLRVYSSLAAKELNKNWKNSEKLKHFPLFLFLRTYNSKPEYFTFLFLLCL